MSFSVPHNTGRLKQYCGYISKNHCIPVFPYNDKSRISLIFVCDELWVFGKTLTDETKCEIKIAESLNITIRYIDESEVDKTCLEE